MSACAGRGTWIARWRGGRLDAARFAAEMEERMRTEPRWSEWRSDPALRREALEEWVFTAALAAEARRLGLDRTPAGRDALHEATGVALGRAREARLAGTLGPVAEEQVEERWRERATDFQPVEKLRLRHLFRRLSRHAPAAEREAERGRLAAWRREVLAGADFGALARAHSHSETAKYDGLIVPLRRGQLPPPVETVVWALAVGETSAIVETPAGLQFFRLEERLPPEPLGDADLRAFFKAQLHQEALARARSALLEELLRAAGARYRPEALRQPEPPDPGLPLLDLGGRSVTVADLEALRRRQGFVAARSRRLEDWLEDEAWRAALTWEAGARRTPEARQTATALAAAEERALAELAYARRLAAWVAARPAAEKQAFYDASPERFAQAEQVRLRLVTLHARPGRSLHAAYERLEELARAVRAGRRDLGQTAREVSDDPSATQAGLVEGLALRDLGLWAGQTTLSRVQRLAPGELSEPLLIEVYREELLGYEPRGYLLARVEHVSARRQRTFEEARAEVDAAWGRERALEARAAIRAAVLAEAGARLRPAPLLEPR